MENRVSDRLTKGLSATAACPKRQRFELDLSADSKKQV